MPSARRIARNTSALLVAESHVARVADPAGGSYAVEKLTDDLAVAAWELSAGSTTGADLAPLVAAVVAERDHDVATPARPITGLSEFPHLAETLPVRAGRRTTTYAATARRSRRSARDRRPARSSWRRSGRSRPTPRGPGSPATCSLPAGSPSTSPAPTTGVDDLVGGLRRAARGVPGRHRRGVRRVGSEAAAALRAAGAQRVVVARRLDRLDRRARPTAADDSCRASACDAVDFLTRTREALAMSIPKSFAGLPLGADAVVSTGSTDGPRDRRTRAVAVARGDRDPAAVRRRRPRGSRRARHLARADAVPARALPDDVHHPAVDDPSVRRVLDRRGVQRLLPAQPRGRPEGAERRLRPGHPPRLRLRPPARPRRRRHGRASRSTRSTTPAPCSTASRSTR